MLKSVVIPATSFLALYQDLHRLTLNTASISLMSVNRAFARSWYFL